MHNKLENIVKEVKQLKESLVRETEEAILEKYSENVETKLDTFLKEEEEDPFAIDPMGETEEGSSDGDEDAEEVKEKLNLKTAEVEADIEVEVEGGAEEVEVTLNLESLQEEVRKVIGMSPMIGGLPEDSGQDSNFNATINKRDESAGMDVTVRGDNLSMEELAAFLSEFDDEGQPLETPEHPVEEAGCGSHEKLEEEGEYNLEEAELREFFQKLVGEGESEEGLEEELTFDHETAPPGMTDPYTNGSVEEQEGLKLAKQALGALNDRYNKNKEKTAKLEEQLDTYKDILRQLKESCEKLNTSNTKLKYQLETYKDSTLNTRQKRIMADKIAMCESIDHAKLVYETLTEAVKTRSYKKPLPEDLREAMNGKGSYLVMKESIHKTEPEEATSVGLINEAFRERMKKNAGLL